MESASYKLAINVLMSVDVDFRGLGIKLAQEHPDIFLKLATERKVHKPPAGYPPEPLDTGSCNAQARIGPHPGCWPDEARDDPTLREDSFEEDGTDRQWCQKAAAAIKEYHPLRALAIIQDNIAIGTTARGAADIVTVLVSDFHDMNHVMNVDPSVKKIRLTPAQQDIRERIRKFL